MEANLPDDHSRTIIHIDMDCFYAQVEMVKNPSLASVPLGIQQKSYVITSNYLARERGIKKCMLLEEAKKVCPDLVLVNGEDLRDYRQTSYRITDHLQQYTPLVERLGLDENFVDVTEIVAKRLRVNIGKSIGHTYSVDGEICECGCEQRLKIGTQISQEIRDSIKKEFNLTTCAGIAHNKLLAKLVGATHKPNQQTVIFPNSSLELLLNLPLRKITGIGSATLESLRDINVETVENLQNCDLRILTKTVGATKAKYLRELSYGFDNTPVKPSGKPQSIGLEDACKSLTIEAEIKEKLLQLLKRLAVLIKEDGRVPKTLKLTVRKFDKTTKTSHRETKQCSVNSSLFSCKNNAQLSETTQTKLMTLIMHLFNKIVDTTKPYHITLLGLSCTKFQEQQQNSLTKFLKKNLEVQSVTSLENEKSEVESPMECDFRNVSSTSDLDSESEPSPKKIKFVSLFSKRRCFNSSGDCMSPSKLSVADLRLNSTEKQDVLTSDNNQNVLCPPNADETVFRELPKDLQKELWEDYKRERSQSFHVNHIKKPKTNTLLNYFVKS